MKYPKSLIVLVLLILVAAAFAAGCFIVAKVQTRNA